MIDGYQQQPWGRFEFGDRVVKLQVLDPITAFELEPEVISRLGAALVMAVVAPSTIIDRVAGDLAPAAEQDAAVARLRTLAKMLGSAIASTDIDGRWLSQTFADVVFDRLREGSRTIESWRDLDALGLHPLQRWQLFAGQLRQTYAPLWLRSPYQVSRRAAPDYGVQAPTTPKAVQWAAALAKMGYASSPDEILTRWTPARMIDVVESAAYDAEVQNRAHDAATRPEGGS